jgi:hypothetical protein
MSGFGPDGGRFVAPGLISRNAATGDRWSLNGRVNQESNVPLKTFYFDLKDGVPSRDKAGIQFQLNSEAINHSKQFAERLRKERDKVVPDLVIMVLDESGREIHREPVYPNPERQ